MRSLGRDSDRVCSKSSAISRQAFRAVYVVRLERAIYVLHCFQKKSPSGIRTANIDVELIERRLTAARDRRCAALRCPWTADDPGGTERRPRRRMRNAQLQCRE